MMYAELPMPTSRRTGERSMRSAARGGSTKKELPVSEEALLASAVLAAELGEDGVRNLALNIEATHRGDRVGVTVRWRWRIVPLPALRPVYCVSCGRRWMCPPMRWAEHVLRRRIP